MAWVREGDFLVNTETKQKLDMSIADKGGERYQDGYKTNNWLRNTSNTEKVQEAFEHFMKTSKMPTAGQLGVSDRVLKNILKDVERMAYNNEIDIDDYQKSFDGEQGELNPYLRYMEKTRREHEGQELGLLNEQTRMMQQGADINAQQAIMQQAQFKNQLLEQIRSDRLGKMRSGLSPMQIAQEEMQFMVGNTEMNNQQIQMTNQQQLGSRQQMNINPFQSYLQASERITGGQGYGNIMSGMAATDAGDLSMQARRLQSMNPRLTMMGATALAQGRKEDELK